MPKDYPYPAKSRTSNVFSQSSKALKEIKAANHQEQSPCASNNFVWCHNNINPSARQKR
ncbi:unnamed protein product [Leptidea sinapis]|uniref:Uncharacterized protein n=1 Tax=Leptidea sinapis TaxID=189913 RepID=A0A5E4Q879_9NEOP|nr:unnamed protein product [Leptidea sinapis]